MRKEVKGKVGEQNVRPSPNSNISNSNHKKVSTTPKTYNELPNIIHHLVESKAINIIPLKPGTKEPKERWKQYQTRQYPLKGLKQHKGNFGVICGENDNGSGVFNLVILDIDDKQGENGLYQHFKNIDTLQVKTPSKGYHLYFWSEKPVTDPNYIGRLFNLKIELRGNRKNMCVLPPSSIRYEDDFIGGHELIKTGETLPIMELEDPEEFIKKILLKSGYKQNEKIVKEDSTPTQPRINRGVWECDIKSDQVTTITELIKPIYKEGQRQKVVFSLSGWLYNAEVSVTSALEIIKEITKGDPEQRRRLSALKNTYRGGSETIKGSGGIWEFLEGYYTNEYQGITEDGERQKKITEDTKQHYSKLAKIIINPLSMEGINFKLKVNGIYRETALRELIRFVKNRYKPIVDSVDGEVYIYNHEEGYYKQYNETSFKQWIDSMFSDYEFFLKDTNKIKTALANIQQEDDHYLWFKNALLNTKTLEFEDHTDKVFTKKRINYNYNPKAQPGLMETKLKEILIDREGDHAGVEDKYLFFLQWIGYCFLNGNPFHTMLFITGTGGNGKSVLAELIKHIFDRLVSSVPLHHFYTEFGPMGLLGKSINLVYDLPKKMLKDTGFLKALVGEDYMTIPIKNKPPWTGKLPLKIIGMGNHLPKVTDASKGFWQRIAHFSANNDFRGTEREETELKTWLTEDSEGMEWLIQKSIKEYKKGPHTQGRKGWALPIGTGKTKTEYLRLSNPCYYSALELFEKTNDRKNYVERSVAVTTMTKLLRNEGLEIPAYNGKYYDAIRLIGGEDDETSKNNGSKKTIRIFRLIKFKDPENAPIEFDNETEFNINNEKLEEYGRNNLNPPEEAILNELSDFSSNKYVDLVESVEVGYKFKREEINIGIQDLIDNEIIRGENSTGGG